MANKRLVYVIPELSAHTHSHYQHLYDLLQETGKKTDVFLVVEHGSPGVDKGTLYALYCQHFNTFPFNIIERGVLFLKLRFSGWKRFYIHQSFVTSILFSMLAKLTQAKTYFWYCSQVDIYEKKEGRKNWLFRLNLKLIDYLVTANEGMKNYYASVFKVPLSNIKVMSGCINVENYQKVDKGRVAQLSKQLLLEDKKCILYIHSLSPRKGSRLLPKIIKNTMLIIPDSVFIIIGDGPDTDWLKQQVTKMGLGEQVMIFGNVPNKDIRHYLHLADVFIMPSLIEEQGRVQFEAMAAGLPFVTFKSIGPDSILSKKQKELMVENGDTEAFAQAIKQAILKHEEYCIENAIQIQQYSCTVGVDKLIKLIN